MQRKLNTKQIASFYHDKFVQQQVEHFKNIAFPVLDQQKIIVDIGGGCGYFASAIKRELSIPTRVIDLDPLSVEEALSLGVEAVIGDALKPEIKNDESVACFLMILHHLVANTEDETKALQMAAISCWQNKRVNIFVNEYIYESWISNFSGWVIYQITKSKILSAIGKMVSKAMPSLKANTFGVGVRFRSNSEWKKIFEKSGFTVVGELRGESEFISLPRRLLLIKEIRRDSFLLAPK